MKHLIFLLILMTTLSFSREPVVSATSVSQGGFFTVTLPGDFEGSISLSGVTTSIKTYSNSRESVAIIPVHYSTPVGDYQLKITNEEGEEYLADISVTDGMFQKSYITVDTSMEKKRSEKNMQTMINHTREARKKSSDEKLWTGEFVLPMKERISSPFGAMRFVNGKISGYHSGIDFAAPVGTPVAAVNSGRVAMAMYLTSSGNTIVVDHGYNLFSSYSHLDKLMVEEGDMIQKGDIIGLSGNTGFTTGPHLHFTLSVGNIFINPFLLIDKTLLEE